MNSKAAFILVRIALALLYVWLVRETYQVMYVDSCLDSGGALEGGGLCTGPSLNQAPDLGARAPFMFWFALLSLPAVLVWVLHRLMSSLVQRLSPNKTMEPTR
jgi:hypothetical protein